MKIIGNGTLITRQGTAPLIETGAVAYKDGKIFDYGTTDQLKLSYPDAEYLDAKGKLIMPGFINTHTHIYSELARGMPSKGPGNANFTEILENLWWNMDRHLTLDDTRASAMATYIECIKNGVTTMFDHHASYFDIHDSLFTIAEVAAQLGIRTSLCYEVSDRDGEAKAAQAIAENAAFIRHAQKQGSDMLTGLFGLHASFTLSDATLEKCQQEVETLNCGYHVHVAEGQGDVRDATEKYGMRTVFRLDRFGIFKPDTLAVHCIHIDEHEMDLLQERGAIVVHNPQSNMGNAVGCARVCDMMAKGILVGMGTDGYTSDMLMSLKTANLIHKHVSGDPRVAWAEPPQMFFSNNPAIVKRLTGATTGVIEEGASADIILVQYDPHTPLTVDNIDSHILFGLTGHDVTHTIIAGKTVMADRELLPVNEAAEMAKAREQARKLWNRV